MKAPTKSPESQEPVQDLWPSVYRYAPQSATEVIYKPAPNFKAFVQLINVLRPELEVETIDDSQGNVLAEVSLGDETILFPSQPIKGSNSDTHYPWFRYRGVQALRQLLDQRFPEDDLYVAESFQDVVAMVRRALHEFGKQHEYQVLYLDKNTIEIADENGVSVAEFGSDFLETYQEVRQAVAEVVEVYDIPEALDFEMFEALLQEVSHKELEGLMEVQTCLNQDGRLLVVELTGRASKPVQVEFTPQNWERFKDRSMLYEHLMAQLIKQKPVWSFAVFRAFVKGLKQQYPNLKVRTTFYPQPDAQTQSANEATCRYIRVESADGAQAYYLSAFRPSFKHVTQGGYNPKTKQRHYFVCYEDLCCLPKLQNFLEYELGYSSPIPLTTNEYPR